MFRYPVGANPDILDEDLHHAIALIQHLCETNAKYVANMMEFTAAVEDLNEEIQKLI